MIQVYKKNELFIIENTVTDIIYPNLTREEALVLLEKFDRNEPEHRCDFAIKEDNISFEYASLDDKDKRIADLEAKLAEKEEQYVQSLIKLEKEYDEQLEKQMKIHLRHLQEARQDKIELLENIKEMIKNMSVGIGIEIYGTRIKPVEDYIDNQIEELKKEIK